MSPNNPDEDRLAEIIANLRAIENAEIIGTRLTELAGYEEDALRWRAHLATLTTAGAADLTLVTDREIARLEDAP